MAQNITGFTNAQLGFLAWLKKNMPGIYAEALTKAGVEPGSTLAGLNAGMGATSSGTSWWSSIINGVSGLGQAYLGYSTQQKILNTQIARAQQGLPPLNASAYTVPVPVQVGLSPATAAQLGTNVSSGLSSMALPLGIGAVALVALMGFKKRRGG